MATLEGEAPRLDISPTRVAASAVATITATVLTSFMGVKGTLVGAGASSVVATAGTAVYSYWFAKGHQTVGGILPTSPGRLSDPTRRDQDRTVPWSEQDATQTTPLPRIDPNDPWPPRDPHGQQRSRPRGRWWLWLLAPLALFVGTMGVITAFEAIAGAPMASIVHGKATGGTSIGQLVSHRLNTDGGDSGGVPASPSPTISPSPSTSTSTATPPPPGLWPPQPAPTSLSPDVPSPSPTLQQQVVPAPTPQESSPTPEPSPSPTPRRRRQVVPTPPTGESAQPSAGPGPAQPAPPQQQAPQPAPTIPAPLQQQLQRFLTPTPSG